MLIEMNTHWDEDGTLKVEDFKNWVWVYGVERDAGTDSIGQPVDRVDFTYSGDIFNIPVGDKEEDNIHYWPIRDSNGINTQLPWSKQYSYYDDIMISSTPMVWYWQQYTEYDPTNPRQYPGIYTRYYDGSP